MTEEALSQPLETNDTKKEYPAISKGEKWPNHDTNTPVKPCPPTKSSLIELSE